MTLRSSASVSYTHLDVYKRQPIHHIQSRVKTLPSIMKKLSDMGQPMTITSAKKHLHDIAGVRVVCCYVDDIYRCLLYTSHSGMPMKWQA